MGGGWVGGWGESGRGETGKAEGCKTNHKDAVCGSYESK